VVGSLVLAPSSLAAPGGDATVQAENFTASVPGATATVLCPGGQRATGGGVLNLTAPGAGGVLIAWSGPVDSTGTVTAIDDGDVPAGWTVAIKNSTAPPTTFKVYALCSATSDATIEVTPFTTSVTEGEASAVCPGTRRATGGGVITAENSTSHTLLASGPRDETDNFANTVDGDIARSWFGRVADQTGGDTAWKTAAVCSAASDATIEAHPTSGAVGVAPCPAGRRIVGGGLGVITGFFRFAGPLDQAQNAFETDDGDVARSWTVRSGTDGNVLALCATDDVPVAPPADTRAPAVSFSKGPKKKTTNRKATFEFAADETATFTCALDKGQAEACTSPFKVKVKRKPGKHKLTVVATDAAGNVGTPAVFSWKLKRKR
jgi:hypothetical protein